MSPANSLFREILDSPDRDRCPGSRDVISFREDEPAEFLRELQRAATSKVELVRRGQWHGRWAEVSSKPHPGRKREHRSRWRHGRPLVYPSSFSASELRRSAKDSLARYEQIQNSDALAAWIEPRLSPTYKSGAGSGSEQKRSARYEISAARQASPTSSNEGEAQSEGKGDDRDLARIFLSVREPDGQMTESSASDTDNNGTTAPADSVEPIEDLWLKLGRLSNHPDDRSRRLRFGFGREIQDDGRRDERRLRHLTQIALAGLPEFRLFHGHQDLRERIRYLSDSDFLPTEPIVYWNAENGGARFHHDAFADDPGNPGRQIGVAFLQVSGRTAWLALSISDLADRVTEFIEMLLEGAAPWLNEALISDKAKRKQLQRFLINRAELLAELAEPGCGRLGPLVDCGPEFTSLLADAGHGLLLNAGDVLLLPNHGYTRTAMHSVFSASPQVSCGLSVALRAV